MTLFTHPSWLSTLIGHQRSNDAFTDFEMQKWKCSPCLWKKKLGQRAFLLMHWQRQESGLIASWFTGTNTSKWTHRWLVYMPIICFPMHPSIFYNQFMNKRGICLSEFVCVCAGFIGGFHGNRVQWREKGALHPENDNLCAKPSNKCSITAYGTIFREF